jgi:hypothetical protein
MLIREPVLRAWLYTGLFTYLPLSSIALDKLMELAQYLIYHSHKLMDSDYRNEKTKKTGRTEG